MPPSSLLAVTPAELQQLARALDMKMPEHTDFGGGRGRIGYVKYKVVEELCNGLSITEIAEVLGVTKGRVCQVMRELGLPPTNTKDTKDIPDHAKSSVFFGMKTFGVQGKGDIAKSVAEKARKRAALTTSIEKRAKARKKESSYRNLRVEEHSVVAATTSTSKATPEAKNVKRAESSSTKDVPAGEKCRLEAKTVARADIQLKATPQPRPGEDAEEID